ncbi:MAG: hypothetical protein ABL957_12815 [Parvularculaceae bacterium]
MAESGKPFDRKTLEQAFERLGELARAAEKSVEISVYGGSALVLTTDFRVSTRDVDAVFERDRKFVREAARVIAAEFGWDATWINDGVKGFLSAKDQQKGAKALFRTYPDESGAGLRVFIASPHYIFAMKCLAMRIGATEDSGDIDDLRKLGGRLGVKSAPDAIALVSKYYPLGKLPPKTQFGLEEIFGGSLG